MTEITWDEFIAVLAQKNIMTQISRIVRSIDRENNGFVTREELDDIFKSFFPELGTRKLISLFDKYSDPIIKVLISYKKVLIDLNKDVLAKRIEFQAEA